MATEEDVSSSDLSDFVDHVKAVTNQYPQMNEDNTKSKILRNFFEFLGWNIAFDAELEYSVTIGSTTNYVDYSLSVDGSSPVLFVEAKGYDTSLTDSHRGQLHSYLRQTDVNWGLLTNGDEYEIYRRENVEDGVEIRTVAEMELAELPDRADYVSLLSKHALESGRSQELAQRIFDIRQARNTLQSEKEDLAERITGTLTEVAGEVVSQEAKTESKVLIDRLVKTLEDQTEEIETKTVEGSETKPITEAEGVTGPEAPAKSNTENGDFWTEVEEEIGIRRTTESIELLEETTAVRDYMDFISFLFENGYLSREELPIESGRIRYVLNTEKKHKDGSEMRNPKEVQDGIYLETHQNTENKKHRIVTLGEKYGVAHDATSEE